VRKALHLAPDPGQRHAVLALTSDVRVFIADRKADAGGQVRRTVAEIEALTAGGAPAVAPA